MISAFHISGAPLQSNWKAVKFWSKLLQSKYNWEQWEIHFHSHLLQYWCVRKWKVSAIYLRFKALSPPNNAWCHQQHSKPCVRCVFAFFLKRKNILNSQSFCSPLPNYNAWSKVGWHQSPRKNLRFETHSRCLRYCILMAGRVKHWTSTKSSDDLCFCLCLVDKILNHSFSIL